MTKKKNLIIFVSDALRYDYLPDSIKQSGTLVPTLSPGITVVSFLSLVSGLSPENHGIYSFFDSVGKETKTVFDLFEHACYCDHPYDAMSKFVFRRFPNYIELGDMEEPFVYIERMMETHYPYAQITHGNELPNTITYKLDELKKDKNLLISEYGKGVKGAERHFWNHISELDDFGILDRSLVVFTADHGEFLGERVYGRKRYGHTFPISQELVKVPTVFFNEKLDIDFMRVIDIIPTCLDIMNIGGRIDCDGVSVLRNHPGSHVNLLSLPGLSYLSKWSYVDGQLQMDNAKSIAVKTFFVDLLDMLLGSIWKRQGKYLKKKRGVH